MRGEIEHHTLLSFEIQEFLSNYVNFIFVGLLFSILHSSKQQKLSANCVVLDKQNFTLNFFSARFGNRTDIYPYKP